MHQSSAYPRSPSSPGRLRRGRSQRTPNRSWKAISWQRSCPLGAVHCLSSRYGVHAEFLPGTAVSHPLHLTLWHPGDLDSLIGTDDSSTPTRGLPPGSCQAHDGWRRCVPFSGDRPIAAPRALADRSIDNRWHTRRITRREHNAGAIVPEPNTVWQTLSDQEKADCALTARGGNRGVGVSRRTPRRRCPPG